MNKYDHKEYTTLKSEFDRQAKVIRNYKERPQPSQSDVDDYTRNFLEIYNKIRLYAGSTIDSLTETDRNKLFNKIQDLEQRFLSYLAIFNCTIKLPQKYSTLKFEDIEKIDEQTALNLSAVNTNDSDSEHNPLDKDKAESSSQQVSHAQSIIAETPTVNALITLTNQQQINTPRIETNDTMPLTPIDFLAVAGRQINKNFNGNPLALQPFLDSIKILETIAGTDHTALLIDFVLSKTEGTIREQLPKDPTTVLQVTSALQKYAAPDNSDIVAGRLQALRADRNN